MALQNKQIRNTNHSKNQLFLQIKYSYLKYLNDKCIINLSNALRWPYNTEKKSYNSISLHLLTLMLRHNSRVSFIIVNTASFAILLILHLILSILRYHHISKGYSLLFSTVYWLSKFHNHIEHIGHSKHIFLGPFFLVCKVTLLVINKCLF